MPSTAEPQNFAVARAKQQEEDLLASTEAARDALAARREAAEQAAREVELWAFAPRPPGGASSAQQLAGDQHTAAGSLDILHPGPPCVPHCQAALEPEGALEWVRPGFSSSRWNRLARGQSLACSRLAVGPPGNGNSQGQGSTHPCPDAYCSVCFAFLYNGQWKTWRMGNWELDIGKFPNGFPP